MTDHLHQLCDFLARVGLKDVPGDALDRARSIVADTVAAIAGGSAEPEVRALTAKMAAQGPGKATVVGPRAAAEHRRLSQRHRRHLPRNG